ncbi:MAG: hypothetical protein Q8R01_09120 [Ramlibacter sp.]|nr:hypothetical protein [Ramlibacter sp.]
MPEGTVVPESRVSRADLAQLQRDGIVEPCVRPLGGAKLATVLEKVGTPKERRRVVLDTLWFNLHVAPPPVSFRPLRELLVVAAEAEWAATVDAEKAFYQVELPQDVRPFCAFRVGSGWWQPCRLPMGMTTAPAVMQRLLQAVTGLGLQGDDVVADVYVDNVALFGPAQGVEAALRRWRSVAEKVNLTIGEEQAPGGTITHRGVEFVLRRTAKLGDKFAAKLRARIG